MTNLHLLGSAGTGPADKGIHQPGDGAVWAVAEVAGASLADAAVTLAGDPRVLRVEPDRRLQIHGLDPFRNQQYGLTRIRAAEAWTVTPGSRQMVVAVLDTGVELNHPDLVNQIWRNTAEVFNGLDDDGNGYVDDVYGYDLVNRDSVPADDLGHGTHVAGIIAATRDNSMGIAGVANVLIMPVKVMDGEGFGDTSTIIEGIEYAVRNGASVINLSLGMAEYSAALEEACHRAVAAGVVVVASSGNESAPTVCYPAAYASVIGVGATDSADRVADFSNRGMGLDLVAPGVSIISTWMGAQYYSVSGTSMACPYVSGAAALVRSLHPDYDVEAVRTVLLGTADDIGPDGYDTTTGYGRLNVYRALTEMPTISTTTLLAPLSGADDAYEENDTARDAVRVGAGVLDLQGLDEDWFLFEVAVAGMVTVRVDGSSGDLDLFVFEAGGQELGRSVRVDSRESVTLHLVPGAYYIAVAPYQNGVSPYTLSIEGNGLAPASAGLGSDEYASSPSAAAPACGAGGLPAMALGMVADGPGGIATAVIRLKRRGRLVRLVDLCRAEPAPCFSVAIRSEW